MTGNATDGQVDQLVKARWLALGLSQKDLAEVLGASTDRERSGGVDLGRLRRVADALGIPGDVLQDGAARIAKGKAKRCAADEPLQSLLELRLLRVFRELQDHNTKRLLIQLAEQIARRQGARHGDAD
jgi:transcriptional regulator with XRE-family HTH domain